MKIVCPSCAAPVESGADDCPSCGRALGTLAIGSVLGSRYELRAVLGKGGMGLVYRAFDRLLEEDVAIKVLRTDQSTSADAVRRFRSEIKLARKVSHPNVCRIHDYGEEGPLGYISMEILTGQDLQKTLKEQPQGLPEAEALSATLQVASGLQAIHEVGIIHRDLKTANVSRDERGVVRLVDFGIAKDLLAQDHTVAGESFGTPEYMSPEHCRGDALDFRSDVYALGVVAFELFTGDVPIRGSTPMATLFKQVQEAVSFEDERGLRVPRRFVPALARALAKVAADRFASPQEFAQALRAAAIQESAPAPATTLSAEGEAPPPKVFKDVRKDERIHLPTDVVFRKMGTGGVLLKEERTVAHDLSRGGMRILTSWSDLEKGDRVDVAEVGGDFSTGAIVRNVSRGTDHITRVGVEFLGKRAPDRLVGTGTVQRPTFTAARLPVTPQPSRNPVPPPPRAPASPPRAPAPPPPDRPLDSGVFRKTSATRKTASTSSSGRISGKVSGGLRLTPPVPTQASIQVEIENAQRLMSESRMWEALECLVRAQGLCEGRPEAVGIRIMVAETQAKIPSLVKAAQQNLDDLARTEPSNAAVHFALGKVLKDADLLARARIALSRAIALDPSHDGAKAALAALKDAGPERW